MSFNELLFYLFIYAGIVSFIMIVFGYLSRVIEENDVE